MPLPYRHITLPSSESRILACRRPAQEPRMPGSSLQIQHPCFEWIPCPHILVNITCTPMHTLVITPTTPQMTSSLATRTHIHDTYSYTYTQNCTTQRNAAHTIQLHRNATQRSTTQYNATQRTQHNGLARRCRCLSLYLFFCDSVAGSVCTYLCD